MQYLKDDNSNDDGSKGGNVEDDTAGNVKDWSESYKRKWARNRVRLRVSSIAKHNTKVAGNGLAVA